MRTVRWFFLALVSVIGWGVGVSAVPLQVGFRLFSGKYDLDYYFQQIAIGNDVMAGSMIYGSKHTISAITGEKAHRGSRWHIAQAWVIDLFFGRDHCYHAAQHENLIKDQL